MTRSYRRCTQMIFRWVNDAICSCPGPPDSRLINVERRNKERERGERERERKRERMRETRERERMRETREGERERLCKHCSSERGIVRKRTLNVKLERKFSLDRVGYRLEKLDGQKSRKRQVIFFGK